MSHDKPTAIVYACLSNAAAPSNSIACVGKCRIQTSESKEFEALIQKNIERVKAEAEEKTPEQKKLCKKLMKQSVAECSSWLNSIVDVSVIDLEVCVSGKAVLDTDGLIVQCLMDAGAAAVVFSNEDNQLLDIINVARVPCERVCAHFNNLEECMNNESFQSISSLVTSISVGLPNLSEDSLSTFQTFLTDNIAITKNLRVVAQVEACLGDSSTQVNAFSKKDIDVLLVDPTPNELGLSFAACIRTDRPDGLYTTVVCSRGGEALGLVYSSKESIVAALECGRGVYYSRSRNSLWRKGDSSGHFQILHRLDIDCDGDALRFTVTQKGDIPAFCHLNTFTCWGKPRGLRHLEETLVDRMISAPEGSYTKRLFQDSELLRNKLVEEAQELSEADNHKHAAEELADVLYFAMVKAATMGVSIDDAAAELDRRARKVTRRQGDSKAFRIAAGNAILSKENAPSEKP